MPETNGWKLDPDRQRCADDARQGFVHGGWKCDGSMLIGVTARGRAAIRRIDSDYFAEDGS